MTAKIAENQPVFIHTDNGSILISIGMKYKLIHFEL